MNRTIKLSQGISYIIIAIAFLLFLAVWPGKLIQAPYLSKSDEIEMMESQPVSVENNITQMFVGEGGELKSVDLYVYNDMQGETITFRLYDASYTQLFNRFYTVKNSDHTPGFINIPVGYCLEDGIDYFYTIEGLSQDMVVALEDYETSSSLVNGYMSYGGIEQPEYNVIARYHYAHPFSWWQILLIAVLIAAVATGLCFLTKKIFEKRETKNRTISVQRFLQWTINPLATVLFVLSILMVYPGKKLCAELENYLFFWSGFTFLYLIVLAYVNIPRKNEEDGSFSFNLEKIKKMPWGNMAQVCAIAGLLWACFEYMNGLYEIHHVYAGYKIIIWIAIMIISTYKKRELFNWVNLIWTVVGVIFGYFYAKPYVGMEEQEELSQLVAKAIFVCGFLVIHFIRTIIAVIQKKEKPAKVNAVFLIPYVTLFVLMCAFRNSTWPVFAAILCGAVFIRFLFWKDRVDFVSNLCNGIILNFGLMWIFCMWHRPYHRYMITRYSMGFHTVTMTGTYLTLVFAAVIVKFLKKYRKDKSVVGLIPECVLLGTVSNYILITLSRTAYLAVVVMGILTLSLYVLWEYEKKKRLKQFVRQSVIALISVLIMFPVTFVLTRTIPAFVNDPVIYDVEERGDEATIRKGQATDSEYYMDLEHFLQYFMRKVVGIDDYEIYWSENRAARIAEEVSEGDDSIDFVQEEMELVETETVISTEIEEVPVALSEEPEDLEEKDISNGRMDIYKAYIAEWNLTGHETMEPASLPCGHAHSIYLQVCHDYGVIVGAYFLVFIFFSIYIVIIKMKNNVKENIYDVFPVTALVGFAVAGIVEWIFHICNPYGMVIFLVMVSLCVESKVKE